ncbi:MAG: hypothetical protein RJB38_457 [Pseudomonadota bacterium]|jgi:MFS family permease
MAKIATTPGNVLSGAFTKGVISTQLVNSALHLAQPLLMAELTNSLGYAALFASFDTGIHMFGTYLGGWPCERLGARRLLWLATALRAVALSAIPMAMFFGTLSPVWAVFWYTADALIRGFVDAAVYTLPLEMAQHQTQELDRLNSRYELAFNSGGIIGPLALGGIMTWLPAITAHAVIPLGFLLAAFFYFRIPQRSGGKNLENDSTTHPNGSPHARSKKGGSWQGAQEIARNPSLLWVCLGYMSFNLYPLRKLLSAFFAKALLSNSALAGPIGAAFSAGGLLGSILYSKNVARVTTRVWISSGAIGVLVLAVGWIPQNFLLMVLAAFLFSLTNVGARLSLIRLRQARTPLELAGGITAVSRFGANLVSVLGKSIVGAAFVAGFGPMGAFALVGAGLATLGLLQLRFANRWAGPTPLTRTHSPAAASLSSNANS